MADLDKDIIISTTFPNEKDVVAQSLQSTDSSNAGNKAQPNVAPLRPELPRLTLALLWRRREKPDPNSIATQPSVYDDLERAKFFQPLPTYENLHRFDPSERWTWAEEKVYILGECKRPSDMVNRKSLARSNGGLLLGQQLPSSLSTWTEVTSPKLIQTISSKTLV